MIQRSRRLLTTPAPLWAVLGALGAFLALAFATGFAWYVRERYVPFSDDAWFLGMLWESTRLVQERPPLEAAWRLYFFMGPMPYPPGLHLLSSVFTVVGVPFPWNGWAAMLTSLVVLGGSLFAAGLRLGGDRVGWTAALLGVSSPLALEYSHRLYLDLPIAAVAALALALALHSDGLQRKAPSLALGAVIGVAFLTKWQGLLPFLPLLWCVAWVQAERPFRAALGAAVLLVGTGAVTRYMVQEVAIGPPAPRLLAWVILTATLALLARLAGRGEPGDTRLRLAHLVGLLATASLVAGAFLFVHWHDFREALSFYRHMSDAEGAQRAASVFWPTLFALYRDGMLVLPGTLLLPFGVLVALKEARRPSGYRLLLLMLGLQLAVLLPIGNLQTRYLLVHLPALALTAALPARFGPSGLTVVVTLFAMLQVHGWLLDVPERLVGQPVIRGVGLQVDESRRHFGLLPGGPVFGFLPQANSTLPAFQAILQEVDARRAGRPAMVAIHSEPGIHLREVVLNVMAGSRGLPIAFYEQPAEQARPRQFDLVVRRQQRRPDGLLQIRPGATAFDLENEYRLEAVDHPSRPPDQVLARQGTPTHFLDCTFLTDRMLDSRTGPDPPGQPPLPQR